MIRGRAREHRRASLKQRCRAAAFLLLILFVPSHLLAETDHSFPKMKQKNKILEKSFSL
jgi:hypothetical protein